MSVEEFGVNVGPASLAPSTNTRWVHLSSRLLETSRKVNEHKVARHLPNTCFPSVLRQFCVGAKKVHVSAGLRNFMWQRDEDQNNPSCRTWDPEVSCQLSRCGLKVSLVCSLPPTAVSPPADQPASPSAFKWRRILFYCNTDFQKQSVF